MDYEYGVRRKGEPFTHREGMTRFAAESFIYDRIGDGEDLGAFIMIRRPLGDWEDVEL